MQRLVLFVLVVTVSLAAAASPTAKLEHKKKLYEKLRAALNATETESAPEETYISSPAVLVQDDLSSSITTETDEDKVEGHLTTAQNYLARFRTVLKRVLELLGLRRSKGKEGRRSRMLDLGLNKLDRDPVYEYDAEVRATVGAALGQRNCIHKVACVSGSYLKTFKAKQLVFALLETFVPSAWRDTVKVAKQSAIFNDACNFKCLE